MMFEPSAQDYDSALRFLYGRINYEQTTPSYRSRELNLAQMRGLLERLGNPDAGLPIVHIAGTKGKGSTAAMISAILVAAGYRVGLYTSPHLSRLEERLAVNGEPCSADELVQLTRTLEEVVLRMDEESDPASRTTFFEITTAMAFVYYVQQQVDLVVLEVGMGGRLDSTNVCSPSVSVITSISFDHTKQLGNTLAAIAAEKAGIIKPGVPVVSGVIHPEPAEVIAEIARQRGCELYRRNEEFRCDFEPSDRGGPGEISYEEMRGNSPWRLPNASLSMLGRHQAANASVALATVSRLREQSWQISDDDCRRGLSTARCPARIEVVSHSPTVILDTAHNLASIDALVATLDESFHAGSRVLLFAVARDKDVRGMLQLLLPKFDHIMLSQFRTNPRGMPVENLRDLAFQVRDECELQKVQLHSAPNPAEAWSQCRSLADENAVICITGSFFLAAELRSLISP